MKDVIEHDHTGLLVPVRSPSAIVESVTRLIESRHLRETLGRRAHEHAREHYTWHRVAQDVLSSYEALAPAGERCVSTHL
jgi:glycosyltransferase involved in cell wall biosynthesis